MSRLRKYSVPFVAIVAVATVGAVVAHRGSAASAGQQARRQPTAEFSDFGDRVDCADEPQNMVDATYTNYLYVTTNGSLPTRASRHYGVTVPHGCSDKDPLMPRPPEG